MKRFFKNKPLLIASTTTALVLIWFIYTALKSSNGGPDLNPVYYSPDSKVGLISPFKNKQEEIEYQKWYLAGRSAGQPDSSIQRIQFAKTYKSN